MCGAFINSFCTNGSIIGAGKHIKRSLKVQVDGKLATSNSAFEKSGFKGLENQKNIVFDPFRL